MIEIDIDTIEGDYREQHHKLRNWWKNEAPVGMEYFDNVATPLWDEFSKKLKERLKEADGERNAKEKR